MKKKKLRIKWNNEKIAVEDKEKLFKKIRNEKKKKWRKR